MKTLKFKLFWGRKVSDLAFSNFLQILEWVAKKKGKEVVYIDRWYPSAKTCSSCEHVLVELDLSVRRWRCPSCQSENDRDENPSINIKLVGATTAKVRGCQTSSACNPCLSLESHALQPWEYVNLYRPCDQRKQMLQSKYRLILVLLISVVASSFLMIFCVSPALADRVFLDLSLDFLAEYRLPDLNLEPPVGGLTAITYDRQRDRFYALCDDRNQYAPARFYTLKLTLNGTPAVTPAAALSKLNATDTEKIGIQIDLESVTFLTDKDGKTYAKDTINPEGIALTPQQTLFISSSSLAPSVQEFDLSGKLLTSLPIPERYLPDAANEVERTRGVQSASGFASLTLNPTGTIPASGEPIRLFTATESALVQDRPLSSKQGARSRFLHYLIGYGPPVLIAEHFYLLEPPPSDATASGLVELLAVDTGGHFLSLERSQALSGFNIQLFQMTTGGATDTSKVTSLKGSFNGIRPLKKKLLLDLNQLGIPLDNLQGMALGPRLSDGTQSLVLVSNNDFAQQATQFLLFRLNRSQSSMAIRSPTR